MNINTVQGRVVNVTKLNKNNVVLKMALNNGNKTHFPQFYGFIPDGVNCKVYDNLTPGQNIKVDYQITTGKYEKNGETVYTQRLLINKVWFQ